MTKLTRALTIALLSAAVAGTSQINSASADNQWQKAHPRREQVNSRLAHQNYRIHREVKEGELTRAQAAGLHRDDRQIRQAERDMAGQNGGHIRLQQRTLNQQENAVGKQVGQ